MKKRLLGLLLVLALALSLNVVAFADPGGGHFPPPPPIAGTSLPIGCGEDCQCEDYDQYQP